MDYLTTAETAARLGLHPASVRKACRIGRLPGAVRLARDWLVPARFADRAEYRAAVPPPGRPRTRTIDPRRQATVNSTSSAE